MYCKKCGNLIKEGNKFCSKCGTPISVGSVDTVTKEVEEIVSPVVVENTIEDSAKNTIIEEPPFSQGLNIKEERAVSKNKEDKKDDADITISKKTLMYIACGAIMIVAIVALCIGIHKISGSKENVKEISEGALPPEPCTHENKTMGEIIWKDNDCTQGGVQKWTCADTACGMTGTSPVDTKSSHTYSEGVCSICGMAEPSEPPEPVTPIQERLNLYYNFYKENASLPDETSLFAYAYIDEDELPEVVLYTQAEGEVGRFVILTSDGTDVFESEIWADYFGYVEKGNMLYYDYGNMDSFWVDIKHIDNGQIQPLLTYSYEMVYDENGMGLPGNFVWDGVSISDAEVNEKWNDLIGDGDLKTINITDLQPINGWLAEMQ